MKHIYTIILLLTVGFTSTLHAQMKTYTGTVKSQNNAPAEGVTIINETTKKTLGTTDRAGHFSIQAAANQVLIFKHVSLNQTTYKLSASTAPFMVVMNSNARNLDEAVVVGYQTRKKETLTGSVVTISGKDIQDIPASNFVDLLQGKVAGLNIQQNTGSPGMRGTMAIRGISNVNISGSGDNAFLTPTSPLFVIDGVPIDDNTGYEYGFQTAGPGISPISMIPTEDIQDIQVLKDAQATALYGSRGAYGVILVTTKRGNSKVPIVQYTSQFFVNTVPKLRPVIGGKGERLIRIQQILQNDSTAWAAIQRINNSPLLADSLNAYYNNSTDWQNIFYRTTINHSQNVNISGGDQAFNYKVNGGIFDEKGIIENTGFSRYSLQMNMQYMPNPKFKMLANINTTLARNSSGSGNALTQSGVGTAANTSSLLPAPSIFSASNTALSALQVSDDNKTANVVTQVELQYEPITGLRGTTTLSYNYLEANKDRFTPSMLNANNSEIYSFNDHRNKLYNRNMLSFTRSFKEKHNLLVYGFSEMEINDYKADVMQFTGTPSDQITSGLSYNSLYSKGGTLNNLSNYRSLGFAGIANYNYASKYVAEFTYRVDGTSTTGSLNPWSYNPSASIRWNFYKENWFENIDWLSFGGLRASWGKNIVPTGSIYSVYGKYVADARRYNNQPTVSLDMNTIPNIALIPQSSTQFNVALEFGLFNNMINVTYENYYKQTDQILREKKIANINAFGNVNTNETSLVNKGHEFQINYRPRMASKDWELSFNFNGAINKDVMAALPDGVRQLIDKDASIYNLSILRRLGINSLSNVLLNFEGVYKTDDEVPVNPLTGLRYRTGGAFGEGRFFRAGDPIWTDLNGDYILDENDYVIVGNSQPRVTGGFGTYTKYKNWTLQTNFSYTVKRDILNTALADRFRNYSNPAGVVAADKNPGALVPISEYDIFTSLGQDAKYPNPFDFTRNGLIDPFRYDQTLFQEDGSYLKFNSATIGYNFDRNWTKQIGITSLRMYLSAYNIYTFSKYSGPDPELVSGLGRDSSNGYPNRRSYTFGLNVQF